MEFSVTIENELFSFSKVNATTYLVTGRELSVIIYKTRKWLCADNVPEKLVAMLGETIDEHMSVSVSH
jgi:hypothetical protein